MYNPEFDYAVYMIRFRGVYIERERERERSVYIYRERGVITIRPLASSMLK